MKENIRVRFAPSPTGPLHIGGVRTALYNYLFAKQNNGKLILRIEDTDTDRFVSGAEEYLQNTFNWLGLEFDESPTKGGEYGPYRQSERADLYMDYFKELIDKGKAYFAFDSAEELNELRAKDENFSYNVKTRTSLKNSLTLPIEEVNHLLETTTNWVVRIKYPEVPERITINDNIRGKIVVSSSSLDDKVIWKRKDNLPTYHLANIVDDHLMKITHVIRGEEWLPSAPLHVYLYQCFNWEAPEFAHLPLILGPDGHKLSKRDGNKYGFPVFPLQWTDPKNGEVSIGYKQQGYLPQAVINILAFLGWNPGIEKEIYSLEELIKSFSINKVNRAGAKFDVEKSKWFNHHYLQTISADELFSIINDRLIKRDIIVDKDYTNKVISLMRTRCHFLNDLWKQADFFFAEPNLYNDEIISKYWSDETPKILTDIFEIIKTNSLPHDLVMDYIKINNLKTAAVMNCVRVALVGTNKGPDLFDIIELLGKETVSIRITKLIDYQLNKNK